MADPDGGETEPEGGSMEPVGPDEVTKSVEDEEGSSPVDSRWWFWIAAVPLSYGLVLAFATLIGTVMLLLGIRSFDLRILALVVFVPGFIIVPIALMAAVVAPLAFYHDTVAILKARRAWQPDPATYTVLAIVGLLTVVGLPLVSLYYLYRRRQHIGVP